MQLIATTATNVINTVRATDWRDALLAANPKASAWIAGKRTKAAAVDLLGISKNDKMPSYTLSLMARATCPRGDKLAQVAGTVCEGCYAMKGGDSWAPSIKAKARRLATIEAALSNETIYWEWIEAFKLAMKKETYFRWHSSGDLFSLDYAALVRRAIIETPWVKHWIPTREGVTARALGLDELANCALRVSDDMIGQTTNKHEGLTSGVHKKGGEYRGVECQSYNQAGECRDCRACWSKDVAHVSYRKH